MAATKKKLYVGVDVGGTKILAALTTAAGTVLARRRVRTPHEATPEDTVDAIATTIEKLLEKADADPANLAAIGVAIPGVVDPDTGTVVITPNMNLTGVPIVEQIRKRIDVPVALGNDANLGTLGEKWLGSARTAEDVVGVFIGTGIGGGILIGGKPVRGNREVAGEIGHMVMKVGGPKCGCGAKGCLEAIASRTAIDRDIRKAISGGKKSIISDLVDLKKDRIRSGALQSALEANDKVVTRVITKAAETIGYALLSIRHLLDPELFVLGGGVVEASGQFIQPIVQEILDSDPLTGARPGGKIVQSALEDDAVALGAAALALQSIGKNPFKRTAADLPHYPEIKDVSERAFLVGGTDYEKGFLVRVSGNTKKVKKKQRKGAIGEKLIRKTIKGGPDVVFIGAGPDGSIELDSAAEGLLQNRAIDYEVLTVEEAVNKFRKTRKRKALLIRV
ncbi:MAG: ROK family protein [Phycisphaerae bacterium]